MAFEQTKHLTHVDSGQCNMDRFNAEHEPIVVFVIRFD